MSRLNYREVPTLLAYARGLGAYLSAFPVAGGEGFAHRHADPLLLASDAEDYFRIESLPEVIASSVGAPATREDAERVCERSYSHGWRAAVPTS